MNLLELMFVPGILLVGIVIFGFWISKIGKPYNGFLFNIHKLIALGATILTGFRTNNLDPLSTFPTPANLLIALTILSVIVMFASGAIMSIQDQVKRIPQLIHQVSASIIAGTMILVILLIRDL
jgi:hypothetical protein